MDPVSILPPEVLESVWSQLELEDLLSCRLVAASWNKCLSSDPVWKRYLGGRGHSQVHLWGSFLELKRVDYRWSHGLYETYTTDIAHAKFAIGDDKIYIGRENVVKCLTPTLEEIYCYRLNGNVVGIHPFSDMVALVLLETRFSYKIRIFRGKAPVRDFQSDKNRIGAGKRLICFQVQNTVVVYDGVKETAHSLPEDVTEVLMPNDRLLVKTVNPVWMGSSTSFYLHAEGGWELVWKGRNTPMGCTFGHLEATAHCVASVGGTQIDSGFQYSGLEVRGLGVLDTIESSRRAYFRSHSEEDWLVYTQSDRRVRVMNTDSMVILRSEEVEPGVRLVRARGGALLLVYQGRWRYCGRDGSGYWRQGPLQVEGAIVKNRYLALWSKGLLHVSYFGGSEGALPSGQCSEESANVLDLLEALPTMSSSIDADGNATKNHITPQKPQEPKMCLSDTCIHTASMLLQNMDMEASPCDDFYQFACGKFRTKIIPDDKSALSTFSVINDELQLQLRAILEEEKKYDELKPITYAKTLYGICMNKSRIEAQGEGKVLNLLKTLGGWPVLEGDSWEDGTFDWRETVYKFRSAGLSVDYIIDFSVSVDYKNTTNRIIDLDQGSLSLNREFFMKGLENRLVSAYAKYMVDMAILMGADPERAKAELAMSLDFEMLLANISLPMEQKRNATLLYNKMTIKELQAKFPSIPWREYISTILPSKISIDEDEAIIVEVPSYITKLEKILEQTPKRVVANYMLWRAANSLVNYMPEKFRTRQLEYFTAVSGSTERESRWKECVDHASSSLSLAVGSLYIQRYFDEEAKKNALDLVRRIREEMYKILAAVEWMDEDTRVNALAKAKFMTEHIAYPDELLENDKLEKFYSGYEISDGDFLDAVLNTTKFAFEFNFGRLRDPVNKTEWFSHGRPTVVNAFYNSIENSIQFPAGILQGVFFSNKRPSYMNYGAIGFVIGHEITHGFDDQGRQFDASGNLVDWWAPETKNKYLDKAKCIINQYGNYTDSQVNMKLNGINTQGENIADNGGLKEAYRAYLAWVEENGEEPRLPGFQNYTPRQMFWLSAASVWCSVYRNETLSNRITTGYHSPGEFRVRGPLSNRPEFAEDYACPTGSPMNPVKKCQVW